MVGWRRLHTNTDFFIAPPKLFSFLFCLLFFFFFFFFSSFLIQKSNIQKLTEVEIGRNQKWPKSNLPNSKKKLVEVEIGRSRPRSKGGAQNFALFPSPATISLFSVSLVSSRGILVFEALGLKCARVEFLGCRAAGVSHDGDPAEPDHNRPLLWRPAFKVFERLVHGRIAPPR